MNMLSRIAVMAIVGSMLAAIVPNAGQAADPRLDLAIDFLVKAKALVEAAEDPGARKPFGGHANKAKNSIEKAMQEIALAKQVADSN